MRKYSKRRKISEIYRRIIYLVSMQISRKANISYPLIHTRTFVYQEVKNVSFSENFANVINGWS